MQAKGKESQSKGFSPSDLVKNRGAIAQLAQSSDAQQLMQLLQRGGGVQEAAQAAADGDPSELIRRMQQLMNTKEGAQLVERISRQAKESGLTGE